MYEALLRSSKDGLRNGFVLEGVEAKTFCVSSFEHGRSVRGRKGYGRAK